MCVKFQVQEYFYSRDMESNVVKGGQKCFFGIFSKLRIIIWFHLLLKEGIMCLHMCAKFQVQAKFCSQYMGSKGVKKGVFWDFLKNDCNNLVHSPVESRYYKSTFVCRVSSPG